MNPVDPVMQSVWLAKESNAKKFASAPQYIAYLRSMAKNSHPAGRVKVVVESPPSVAALAQG